MPDANNNFMDLTFKHACDVDEMNQICREKFVELYETPIVEQLSKVSN